MKRRKAAFIYSPEQEKYHYPPGAPFRTERPGHTRELVASLGLLDGEGRELVEHRPATRGDLEKFHTAAYLDELESVAEGGLTVAALMMGIGTPDCPAFPEVLDHGLWACGATLTGADLILSGRADIAFNPSGGLHHAKPGRAAGFCYVNDLVLGCMRLADGPGRLLVLDLDAHHGDGQQLAFWSRSDVMTISLHQSGRTLFPGTGFEDEIGEGEGKGYNANVPLPPGTYDEAYLKVFRQVVLPLLGAFEPDAIALELGLDTLAGDPLAQMNLTNNVYVEILTRLMESGLPILATGGGGYHVENTVRGWALAWNTFVGEGEQADEAALGLGGVFLQSSEWLGGLRDRHLPVHEDQRRAVEPAVDAAIEAVRRNVFKYHGLA